MASDVIWLVRHAQSTANAGAPAANYPTIPLSELGWLQARSFVKRVPRAPERIVWSPFLRARQTAEPLLAQFPHVPTAELPVEEFSYLHFPGDRELTWQDRAPRVEAYWARQDPLHRDGGVGESYADLVERVRQFLHAARGWRGFQVVFSHEQFMRGVALQVLTGQLQATDKSMALFALWRHSFRIPNVAVLALRHQGDAWWLATSDAPPDPLHHAGTSHA
ncbi:MAG: histidine phosphatase family protein [Planctomycetaceae bacterium]